MGVPLAKPNRLNTRRGLRNWPPPCYTFHVTTNVNWSQPIRPVFIDAPNRASATGARETPLDHTMVRDVSREVARIRAEQAIQRSGERLRAMKEEQ